jgi:hypothetical protein
LKYPNFNFHLLQVFQMIIKQDNRLPLPLGVIDLDADHFPPLSLIDLA